MLSNAEHRKKDATFLDFLDEKKAHRTMILQLRSLSFASALEVFLDNLLDRLSFFVCSLMVLLGQAMGPENRLEIPEARLRRGGLSAIVSF
jgi:hypothetical protein